MGLDVFLYWYEDFERIDALEKEYEELSEKNWDAVGVEYEAMTEKQKDEVQERNKSLAFQMGLDSWGECIEGKKCIEIVHDKYPKHLFKIGYWRSSYNNSGIDSVLRNTIGMSLNQIVEAGDEYIIQPDWNKVLGKMEYAYEKFKEFTEAHPFNVFDESVMSLSKTPPQSGREALDIYIKEKESHKVSSFGAYSSSEGSFWHDEGTEIFAIIPGTNFMGACMYFVFKKDYSSYYESFEIMIDTIKYVLNQPDPEKYYLSWSG